MVSPEESCQEQAPSVELAAATEITAGAPLEDSSVRLKDDKEGSTDEGNGDASVPLTSTEQQQLEQAMTHYEQDQLMAAARLLRQIPLEKLPQRQRSILELAQDAQNVVTLLRSDVNASRDETTNEEGDGGEWTKLSDSAAYNSILHYRVDESTMHMTVRIDCPLPHDLLIPLLAVLNETSLYLTWLPQFTTPRICFERSQLLAQLSRAWQVFVVTCAVPWPFSTRECVISALAWEDIATDEYVGVRMRHVNQPSDLGLNNDTHAHLVPPVEDDVVRIGFEGGIVFRKCPPDHFTLQQQLQKANSSSSSSWWGRGSSSSSSLEQDDSSLSSSVVLTSVIMKFDPKVTSVPQFLMNFVLRTVFGTVWYMLVQVAESVRDGKRPAHTAAVQAKREVLYNWMEERIQTLLHSMDNDDKEKDTTTAPEEEEQG